MFDLNRTSRSSHLKLSVGEVVSDGVVGVNLPVPLVFSHLIEVHPEGGRVQTQARTWLREHRVYRVVTFDHTHLMTHNARGEILPGRRV